MQVRAIKTQLHSAGVRAGNDADVDGDDGDGSSSGGSKDGGSGSGDDGDGGVQMNATSRRGSSPRAAASARVSSRRGAQAQSSGVEVSTVDGFQGREKEVIVFSAVRCNQGRRVGFLADSRRLNVALTRARRGLVVVGDQRTLAADPTWRDWLAWVKSVGAVVVEPESIMQRTRGQL